MITPIYALRHKESGKLMHVEVSGHTNHQDFANSYEASLSEFSSEGVLWTTFELEKARTVSNSTVEWYNSCLNTPMNPFIGELEVIDITKL